MPPAAIRVGVDPNTAPWWELACLPRVGEATARKIVHFRKEATTKPGTAASPVFSEPADLERVPGIGPRTVLRITRDLRFE
jgi:DNA uptake protein ComE-like DNA-binding protein